MADVDRLFEEFIERQLAGEKPDPYEYMDKLTGDNREELGDLIEEFLEQAPREAWDPEGFRGSAAEQIVEQFDRSMSGASGLWPSLLPRLRHRLKIQREELVKRLADSLDVGDKWEKVGIYYHRMEQGRLPSQGVSDKVLESLGSIVGMSAEALRRAGRQIGPAGQAPPADAQERPAFARKALPDPDYMPDADETRLAAPESEEADEVDRLFQGG